MKTTVDIPEIELEEAMRHSGAKTKKQAIVTAIADYNRRRRRDELLARLGRSTEFMTSEELQRMRERD